MVILIILSEFVVMIFCFILLQLTAKLFHYQLMSHLVFYFENPVYILILLSFVQHCIRQRCSSVT